MVARKHSWSFQNPQKSQMFSSMNDSQYTVYVWEGGYYVYTYICTYVHIHVSCGCWQVKYFVLIFTQFSCDHMSTFLQLCKGIFIDSNNACMQSCTFGRHNIMFGTNPYICSDTEIV